MIYIIVIALNLFSLFAIPLVNAETLRFTAIDYCPFTCDPLKENGKEGIMTDVVRAAFEEAGYAIKIKIMPYVRAVRAVSEGSADGVLVVGKNYAPELVYPKSPTLTQRIIFMVKPTTQWRYTDYHSLLAINITMLVINGFDYADDDLNEYVSEKHHNLAALHGMKTTERGLQLLTLERADTYIEGEFTALYYIDKYGYSGDFIIAGFSSRTFENYTAFNPHSPNADKYAHLLSDKIAQLQQSGELTSMLKKYGITRNLALNHRIGETITEH